MRLKTRLLSVGIMAAIGATALPATAALAQTAPAASNQKMVRLDIPAGPASASLNTLATQADVQLFYPFSLVNGRSVPAIQGEYTRDQAVQMMAQAAGLEITRREGDAYALETPQGGSAAGGGATVEALVVTAQKREEDIQDVPIAISAFSQKQLEAQKIEGGFDLLKAIPNVTFSKNNFTGYNFSIRGVGTKAISATTDPGVAVAFNNTSIIQNRLFEQEYYDLERVEVLRGPQGTLYGRNATSGVINVISAKPDLNDFEGSLKAEVGGYDTKRLVGMINIPILQDRLAIRLAGAGTQRDGYDYNSVTQNRINGRDLWSTRLTVGFEPTTTVRGNLIWEHFEEDDNRSRTGKQLCHRDPGPDFIGDVNLAETTDGTPGSVDYQENLLIRQATYSLGCQPGNLYDDEAFGTPNGLSINFILPFLALRREGIVFVSTAIGIQPGTNSVLCCGESLLRFGDPYGGLYQSRDLREIASIKDPVYRAKADIYELNVDFDITPSLTFSSQTAYVEDETYSFQDYNRFNTLPVFNDTLLLTPTFNLGGGSNDFSQIAPRPEGSPVGTPGVFCDPQLGCSDTIAGFDIAQGEATQFNQELRLQSDFDGPVNFSIGANYTKFATEIDYYVFFNVLTAFAQTMPLYDPGGLFAGGAYEEGVCAYSEYFLYQVNGPVSVPTTNPYSTCPYIDPNPIESIDGNGHNYFRSKNPYELESWAGFGEVYWNLREDLKITAGLRYTEDTKTFIPVPSQVLLAPSFIAGGTTSIGYPEDPPIIQEWGEWTGRLGIDWKPELSFTDESLLYAFYSHGYKGGGANPPRPGFGTADEIREIMLDQGYSENSINGSINNGIIPILFLSGDEYGETFEPEFVNAFEFGSKNTLLNGGLTLNITAFYYDYIDYQVSQIRDRTAVNENFDATTWGIEFETLFAPNRDFQLIGNFGYLDTRIGDGEQSIDLMDRTQGNPDFIVVKPWLQLPSNCVIPTGVAANFAADGGDIGYYRLCPVGGALGQFSQRQPIDPATGEPYDRTLYDGTNGFEDLHGGAGIFADLSGNELPNAPHFTTNIGAQYGRDILDGSWRVTLRGDAYWQSQSWARVYNTDPYDKLHGWYNLNVSVNVANEELGLEAEFYVKNLLDKSPITDAFLNSDDTGLTTNVFVLDPRLVGFYVRKTF